jgi:tetrahydromethanopterin S-methyltransferase subunit B
MQTAEQFITNSIEDLLEKIAKLERVAEQAAQVKETYGDKFASYNEKQYVLEKLDESLLEYELFLNK